MGRPVKFDKEKALDAAMDLFWEHGFEAATISDLSDAMGITRSSFYNSFESREKLFEDVLNHYSNAAPDNFLNFIKPGDPVLPAIKKLFDDISTVRTGAPTARGCLLINCLGELSDSTKELSLVRIKFDAKLKRFEELLEQAKQQHELPKDFDSGTAARELLTFLVGINMTSKVIRDEETLSNLSHSFLKTHGLLAQPTSLET